ncbi:MAG: hypothetical protein AAFX39_16245 [Pseudomonadota bacterium]
MTETLATADARPTSAKADGTNGGRGADCDAGQPAEQIALPKDIMDKAIDALRSRDWPTALDHLAPFIAAVQAPAKDAPSIVDGDALIAGARLGAMALEQTGALEESRKTWQGLFAHADALGQMEATQLGDHISFLRVTGRLGRLEEAQRRGFVALVGRMRQEFGMPEHEYRMLVGVTRFHIGTHFLISGEPEQAFDQFAKSLYLATRYPGIFRGARTDIEGMYRQLAALATELRRSAWRGVAVAKLEPALWINDTETPGRMQ